MFKNRFLFHSLCLSTLQHRRPSGGIHSYVTLAGQPQPLWFAHLSLDSPPSLTSSSELMEAVSCGCAAASRLKLQLERDL
ncbi:hypothetical protein CRENBAI_000546 [Crenichthys baileyi]|uniref:Uncharacterized protein n=1 Tax=Crenichthys baileyi TaxID=28760 RepID=A0AAV9R216_9TELE